MPAEEIGPSDRPPVDQPRKRTGIVPGRSVVWAIVSIVIVFAVIAIAFS